eukprot:00757.XXX_1436_2232_1 [CDS] Oithona nana genome sequencing.
MTHNFATESEIDGYRTRFAGMPEIANLGPLINSTRSQKLSITALRGPLFSAAEYRSHIFGGHILVEFQFCVTKEIDDLDIEFELLKEDEGFLQTQVIPDPCPKLTPQMPTQVFALFERQKEWLINNPAYDVLLHFKKCEDNSDRSEKLSEIQLDQYWFPKSQ